MAKTSAAAPKRAVKTLVEWEYPNGYRNAAGEWVPGVFHRPGDVEMLSVDDVPDLETVLIPQGVCVYADSVPPAAPTVEG